MRKLYYIIIDALPWKFRRTIETLKWGVKLMVEKDSYLVKTGYVDSLLQNDFLDKEREVLPWMNYYFIDFLKDRLTKDHSVFEYGSGFSTLFFAKRTCDVTSIESNKEWYEKVCNMTRNEKNVRVVYIEDGSQYPKSIKTQKTGKKYDVVIVDGSKRSDCMKTSWECLSANGVVILDDSNRPGYQEGIRFYLDKGFSIMKFYGLKPGQFFASETTLIYRLCNNCFGL